jgi:hypothetical protein
MSRYHQQKLHLEKNTVHREITFSSFKPGGNVSVYQFLNKFEAWADGYLSEEAKADLLFNKYLDTSITESYTEITLIQDDFEEMKRWLIKKYGSVVPIARGCIKAIAKLTMPAESNHSASVIYLRGVHKLLVNLSELELTKAGLFRTSRNTCPVTPSSPPSSKPFPSTSRPSSSRSCSRLGSTTSTPSKVSSISPPSST